MGCLYQLTFPGGKSYIGITVGTAEQRFAEHLYNSTTNRADRAVNRAILKYGIQAVRLQTLVIAGWDYLVELERKAITAYGTLGPGGYNMTAGGEGTVGYKHTAESLRKMGDVHRGKAHHTQPHSAEAKAKMSASAIGRKHTAEAKEKIGIASIGNKHCLGRKLSEEHKLKIKQANTGRKWTEESRARMSFAATKRETDRRAGRTCNEY